MSYFNRLQMQGMSDAGNATDLASTGEGATTIRNATLTAGTPNFASYAATSCTFVDTAATACAFGTNDQIVWTASVAESGDFSFMFTDEISIQPGETMTLAVRSVTATATVVGSLNTREDQ